MSLEDDAIKMMIEFIKNKQVKKKPIFTEPPKRKNLRLFLLNLLRKRRKLSQFILNHLRLRKKLNLSLRRLMKNL
jgi:hypothetical protein